MNRRRWLLTLMFVLPMAMMVLCGTDLHAQIPWNPPCSSVTIFNKTNCTFPFTLATTPAGLVPTFTYAPGQSMTYPMPSGSLIDGVFSMLGNQYNFVPVASPPAPAPWKVTAVTMGPPDCCVDVYADPSTCTVTIVPSSGPFPCND